MYKYIFDFIFVLFCIVLLIPVIFLICLIVKFTSAGPIILSEQCIGKNNKLFYCYKFRTTYAVYIDNINKNNFTYSKVALTPFGQWLRCLGFDELPQLFNVLKGDMSLIGPRSYRAVTVADAVFLLSIGQIHDVRHSVRPGITGWAQVNGYRGPASTAELKNWHLSPRLQHDLYYIKNWSFLLDLKILFMTMLFLVTNKYSRQFEPREGDHRRA
jgi:putative colanic acid biosynthesis UDP-glucose lipid carrier transferase